MSQAAFNLKTAQCPGCGVPLTFKVGSSRVVVCDYCNFAVARGDRGLENLGKVADLVPTGARLALGVAGRYEGVGFKLVGRLQYEWQQGVWDEWYVAFRDGRWGWLAEAQGRYYLSFRVTPRPVPPWTALRPGRQVFLSGYGRMVVTDLKQARYVAAQGELPEPFTIGETARTADLSGPQGVFGTLDYSEGDRAPIIFVGREVPFEELQLSAEGLAARPKLQRIKADKLVCPKCRAPIALQVPDQTMRVTCGHCNSLLDATEGTLRHLAAIEPRKLQWKLGSRCTFFGKEYLTIGWLERCCMVDGLAYLWQEYLLYDEESAGYRFLVNSEGHWSFVSPLSAGDVEEGVTGAVWKGQLFKPFSSVSVSVTAVLGEFYWAVAKGETVEASDFIRPPEGLTVERSADEVNWSHAQYLSPEEVWRAYGSNQLPPRPLGVGSMQPCPYDADVERSIKWALWGIVACVLLMIVLAIRADEKVVFEGQFPPGPVGALQALPARGRVPEPMRGPPSRARAPEGDDRIHFHAPTTSEPWAGTISFTEPFTIEKSHRNLQIRIDSNVSQSWAFVSGALINETTNEFTEFSLESSYYSGFDDGYWTEDKREAFTYLSSPPPGRYLLRVESGWEPGRPAPTIKLRITSGVARLTHFLLALVPIVIFPIILLLKRASFESARWAESNLAGDDDE